MTEVFERIEKLRKEKGISQGKLEKELGFSNGSISKWSKSMPTHERLQKVADYFNVSTEYLATGKEPVDPLYYFDQETAKMADELFHNKPLRMLFDAERDLAPEDMDAVFVMVSALKRKKDEE